MICFLYSDSKVGKTMTLIGKITDGIEKLSVVNSGSELKLYCETGT